jgi:hypothetical protein
MSTITDNGIWEPSSLQHYHTRSGRCAPTPEQELHADLLAGLYRPVPVPRGPCVSSLLPPDDGRRRRTMMDDPTHPTVESVRSVLLTGSGASIMKLIHESGSARMILSVYMQTHRRPFIGITLTGVHHIDLISEVITFAGTIPRKTFPRSEVTRTIDTMAINHDVRAGVTPCLTEHDADAVNDAHSTRNEGRYTIGAMLGAPHPGAGCGTHVYQRVLPLYGSATALIASAFHASAAGPVSITSKYEQCTISVLSPDHDVGETVCVRVEMTIEYLASEIAYNMYRELLHRRVEINE